MAKKDTDIAPVEETAESLEELAAAIKRIDKGIKLILSAGLTRRAILLLVSSASGGMSQAQVSRVIDGLDGLADAFLEKK